MITKPFPLHLTEEAKARYKSAAHKQEMSISEWMRVVLDAAAKQTAPVVIPPPPAPSEV